MLRRVGKAGVVGAVYHIPAGSHEDFAAVEVLEDVLTSEPSGRLYKALVPTKKASSVSGIRLRLPRPRRPAHHGRTPGRRTKKRSTRCAT